LALTPIVYKRNYLVRGDELNKEDNAIDFDVVTELVFPDRAAYLAWRAQLSKPGSGERVVADEEKFLDRSRTRACVIEECVTSG
jgi:EthD domain-containing protein